MTGLFLLRSGESAKTLQKLCATKACKFPPGPCHAREAFVRSRAWSGLCLNAQKRQPAPAAAVTKKRVLASRLRRNRKADWTHRLVRENILDADDVIWPVFLCEGKTARQPVASMPGVERLSIERATRGAAHAAELGIPALALFPFTKPGLRNEQASEALNPENLISRACPAINREVSNLGLMTDAALDPYTSRGHDGILRGERILNDETVFLHVERALNQACAGADIIAPSDKMDVRAGAKIFERARVLLRVRVSARDLSVTKPALASRCCHRRLLCG